MDIAIALPGYASYSNGLRVIHEAALEMVRQGHRVRIIPWDHAFQLAKIPVKYWPLYQQRFALSEAVSLLPDTTPPHIVHEMRYATKHVVWWLCNVPGLLGNPPPRFEPHELLFAYSQQVSPHLPNFYYHPPLPEIEQAAKELRGRKKTNTVIVYTGKGKVTPLPQWLVDEVLPGNEIQFITRFWPETKKELNTLLAEAKAMISYDPLSNISYEATFFATPVYLVHPLRSAVVRSSFNVPLRDNYVDKEPFLQRFRNPHSADEVWDIHQQALATNPQRTRQFLAHVEQFTQGLSAEESASNARINERYNRRYPREVKVFRPLFNPSMGGEVETPFILTYRHLCVERPDLFQRGKRLRRLIISFGYPGYFKQYVRSQLGRVKRTIVAPIRFILR